VSRTFFWSCSIFFCCKCDSAVVCVSCKKPQFYIIRNPTTFYLVISWISNICVSIIKQCKCFFSNWVYTYTFIVKYLSNDYARL
jgi:hypothetical protein